MPKIFELAQELNMGALDLVEKFKALGLNVRSHMSLLSDDEAQKALEALEALKVAQKQSKTSKTSKKKTTKKKVAVKKVAVKKVAVKKVLKKKPHGPKKALVEGDETTASKAEVKEARSQERDLLVGPSSTAAKSNDAPKVLRKKAATIAEEKAQKAKEREEQLKKEEPLPRTGLKVVFDPTTSGGQDSTSKVSKGEPSPLNSPPKISVKTQRPFEGRSLNDDEDKKDHSKKRMGVLSQMVANSKGMRRDLTQLRADEEMKSYGLGPISKVNYIPMGRKKVYLGPSDKTLLTETKEDKRYVNISGAIQGVELAKRLKVKFKDFSVRALDFNFLIRSDDYLGEGLAAELASLYDYHIRDISFKEESLIQVFQEGGGKDENWPLRNPVLAVMGHVDHGKTTLLDAIRKTKVVESEAGGITQHMGAYQVEVSGQKLTFLDTPGHAAFAAMRQRGADVTDIVILVVAADDGVMPQTKESIRFCQQTEVPIIVAVNKMDKEGANDQRIRQELVEFGLVPEDWGGETQYVNISALKGEGLDDLLERIKLLAEILEIKADCGGQAEGVVIESSIDQGRGPVTTLLVQKGTLCKGDNLVVGETYGRARYLSSDQGTEVSSSAPGEPVQVLGLQEAPAPGDIINVVKSEREAKKIVQNRRNERKQLANVKAKPKLSLEDFFATAIGDSGPQQKTLNLIIRTDMQGSYEAIKNALEALANEEVAVKVVGGGVGAITDSDVTMAANTLGYIIGFNMRPVTSARRLAEEQGVEIKTYSIIYELIDDLRAALEGLLDPEEVEVYMGRATVKEIFQTPKSGTIAGSSVIDGKIKKGCHIRLLREGKIIFNGRISSLRRFKDDQKEVGNGMECGIGLEDFNDLKRDDIFEAYLLEERKRKLEPSKATL